MVRFHQLEVVRRLPHPGRGFTQGLIVAGDTVWESTGLYGESALLAHEARHATPYAWCAGLAMLPLYFAAAAGSWVLTGDFGSRNIFETRAGLADGGYSGKPLRPPLARCLGRRPARP